MTGGLSSSQQGIYLECIAYPESTLYNLPFLGHVHGDMDPEQLRRALLKAIGAHPALNAVLFEDEEGNIFLKTDDTPPAIPVYTLSDEEFARRKGTLVRPFDLNGGKLVRFEIYRTPSGLYLFEDIHHVVFDGTSGRILEQDVGLALEGGEPEKERLSLFELADLEEEWLQSEEAGEALAYWKAFLSGCETGCEPERDRWEDQKSQGWLTCYAELDEKAFSALRHRAGFSTCKLYVTDGQGHELPPGAMGELWIAGYGVGRGYLHLPEKTAEVFIPNPFCGEPGFDRVYRTGDVVRRLGDGRIDFIGRSDGQVKIRGFRIELVEIEGVIREYPGIRDVTVQAFDDEAAGGKYIAAYVVADTPVDFDRLGDYIRDRKPPYMVPAAFMQLDVIPLNQNQKVNKRALPKPERREANKEYVEPATPLERELCEEYAAILGLEKVSATDSFFDIGGSSISAAQVIMFAMNKGYSIVYKDVFVNPSPRELARVIAGMAADDRSGAAADFDYTAINKLIAFNAMEHVDEISARPVGNVILTGATGFLGIHVLKALLDKTDVKITCLMRCGRYETAERRMKEMLMYYFGEMKAALFGTRIFCAEGDLTDPETLKTLDGADAGTVINCAASVKHFANDDLLDRVNFHGVENLVELCLRNGMRLVHVSTLSVGGEMETEQMTKLKENMLYFGQNVRNDYVRTKFLAERAILDARVKRGLDAVILRAGNLMGRHSDGEFQINFETNAFMRSLWAYVKLRQCPFSILESPVEFSPIDSVAEAVLKLAGVDSRFSVFHMNNNHTVTIADLMDAIRRHGFEVRTVPDSEFRETLAEAATHEDESRTVLSLVAYSNKEGETLRMVDSDRRFTVNALFHLGFRWPIVDDEYLEKIIWALDSLSFFTEL